MRLIEYSDGEPNLFWIEVEDTIIGSLEVRPFGNILVMEELTVFEPGVVNKSFLKDLLTKIGRAHV